MKIQDGAFFVLLIVLLLFRKPKAFVYTGLSFLLIAVGLFTKWVFFTAERLTWYAAAFFLLFTVWTGFFQKEKI